MQGAGDETVSERDEDTLAGQTWSEEDEAALLDSIDR